MIREVLAGIGLWLLLCISAFAGVVVTNVGTNSGSGTVTLTGVTIPAGSLIIAVLNSPADALSTTNCGTNFSDTASNTYRNATSASPFHANSGSATPDTILCYAFNSTALSSGTITTSGIGTGTHRLNVAYATGIQTSSNPFNSSSANLTNSNGTATTSPSVTSGAPGETGDLFVGSCSSASNNGAIPQSSGWTNINTTNVNTTQIGYIINAGSGTESYNPTSAPSNTYGCGIMSFKAAPSGGFLPLVPTIP